MGPELPRSAPSSRIYRNEAARQKPASPLQDERQIGAARGVAGWRGAGVGSARRIAEACVGKGGHTLVAPRGHQENLARIDVFGQELRIGLQDRTREFLKGPQVRRARIRRNAVRSRQSARITLDRKSTRLNSSHKPISYAVFCLNKKKISSHLSPRANQH